MRQAVLLGNPGTKRTLYLEKGVREEETRLWFWDWKAFLEEGRIPSDFRGKEIFLKIDPPLWDSCCLKELNRLTEEYETQLKLLETLAGEGRVTFFNSPEAILSLLDKRTCKDKLKEAGISVTESLEGKILHGEQLLELMGQCHVPQVFIKPLKGSGAAGIAAFRYQKRTGQMILYTCGMRDPATGRLVNTKRLRRFTERNEIMALLDSLLMLDSMVERWYAKDVYQGFSYDLRAVVQDGQLDFILARLSKGPITNLHLNNHPLKAAELGLPSHILEETETLCRRAAACYKDLRSVGIDILLEKGSLKPRIIEMNGQGDLIYQDIYDKNMIYRHQAKMMKEWLHGEE